MRFVCVASLQWELKARPKLRLASTVWLWSISFSIMLTFIRAVVPKLWRKIEDAFANLSLDVVF